MDRPKLSKQKQTVVDEDQHSVPVQESHDSLATPHESPSSPSVDNGTTITNNSSSSDTTRADQQNGDAASVRSNSKQLVRGLALCGDDDTRLRPPPDTAAKARPFVSKSTSRDSTATVDTNFTDSSGVDLNAFLLNTLHKNQKDRQMVLELEKQLIEFLNDEGRQSYKFPIMSSYNRMLVHRVAAMFGLDHNVDQSGQRVVVNKGEQTKMPACSFSSLIRGDNYTDNRRFPRRDVQSFDQFVGYREYTPFERRMISDRRTRSFEVGVMPMSPPIAMSPPPALVTAIPAAEQLYYPAPSDYYFAQQRSFAGDEIPIGDVRPQFQRAGSFGGMPGYYCSRDVQATPSIPEDDPSRWSEAGTGSTSGRASRAAGGTVLATAQPYPPPLMSMRVPPPDTMISPSYYDPSMVYGTPQLISPIQQQFPPIGVFTPPQTEGVELVARQLAGMNMSAAATAASEAQMQQSQQGPQGGGGDSSEESARSSAASHGQLQQQISAEQQQSQQAAAPVYFQNVPNAPFYYQPDYTTYYGTSPPSTTSPPQAFMPVQPVYMSPTYPAVPAAAAAQYYPPQYYPAALFSPQSYQNQGFTGGMYSAAGGQGEASDYRSSYSQANMDAHQHALDAGYCSMTQDSTHEDSFEAPDVSAGATATTRTSPPRERAGLHVA